MHVFAPFARKRATPRASRSCAVPDRPEAVENAKKAPYPKKNRVLEKSELGSGVWVRLGSTGFEPFGHSPEALDWVRSGFRGFFQKNTEKSKKDQEFGTSPVLEMA